MRVGVVGGGFDPSTKLLSPDSGDLSLLARPRYEHARMGLRDRPGAIRRLPPSAHRQRLHLENHLAAYRCFLDSADLRTLPFRSNPDSAQMSKRQLAVIGRVHGLQKSGIILYTLELYSPPRLGRTTRSSSQQPPNTPLQAVIESRHSQVFRGCSADSRHTGPFARGPTQGFERL